MWEIEVVDINDEKEINSLLKDGWEPFSTIKGDPYKASDIGQSYGGSSDKIYFRKKIEVKKRRK